MRRRDFLLRFCQSASATLIPKTLWGFPLRGSDLPLSIHEPSPSDGFYLHPRYRSERPLDATLLKVSADLDRFPSEKFAARITDILGEWSTGLLRSPRDLQVIAKSMAGDFKGASAVPSASEPLASSLVQICRNRFSSELTLAPDAFLRTLQSILNPFAKIDVAEFEITRIDGTAGNATQLPARVETTVRYEIVGTSDRFHREQRVGTWKMTWVSKDSGEFRLKDWRMLDETCARSISPIYVDATAAALGGNPSYSAQMLHGTDYWRTMLDGACGIDIYGHNGVSTADIDNDGFDEIYVCQPAGLPNRLYRNRGDGTFEDITESSGLGILENTACALFADFDNDGHQDVILVRTNGPLLFRNRGRGQFELKPDAFHFANPPQGTFTGAAVADYDRDGWLDIYFCLYSYYQGTGQYKYPSPYHDAENGPPNFMMRNNRDGTFRDVTAESGLNQNNTRYSFCCAWGDYNRDGWPDLYVVNDFGRKNLYRNSGTGTFTDVAPQAGVEDVGAGMSVCWTDFDNDGSDDLYVANMWTAAGVRVSMQDEFKTDSHADIRSLYQKHAMGNSLLLNRPAAFHDATNAAGVGMGRWSWSSDAIDFDHDGFADLYIANGMISGPSRDDLNSFFWRQVVANSPDVAGSSLAYEQGWNAINELIRSDATWSGYERNVFYKNNRDGTFSDISGALGLDFVEDGRSFALADLDHDGRLEIVLKNRSTPQLRLLKNVAAELPPSIAFHLQGTKSNRDAIGAVVTIHTSAGNQSRSLQAGSGFLSQHSKDIFFGLGDAKGSVHASIRWPSGLVQELRDLPMNCRVWVEEGSASQRTEPFKKGSPSSAYNDSATKAEILPNSVETWLLVPIPAPQFSLPHVSGKIHALSNFRGKPLLLNFCSAKSADCHAEFVAFENNHVRWTAHGLQLVSMNVDAAMNDAGGAANSILEPTPSFLMLSSSEDVAATYNILYRQIFDRHRDLVIPTSFLIDADGMIVKIYQGPVNAEHVEQDFRSIPRTDAERIVRGLPFPGPSQTLQFGRNYLSLGALFFQRGYLDQAEVAFQQALHDDPASAEALYGIGSVYLNQNKNSAARELFERCVKLTANYPDTLPDAWNNLGVLATRENRVADAVECFQRALSLNPRHLLSLDNLGNAYRLEKRWDDAHQVLERALEVAPDDPEANYSLGMVFAQIEQNDRAYEHLQRALKAKPNYPEALNNLGVLYIVTQRRDQAVTTFEQCIRVAPAFDQAYLNLARVYALEGAHDKARTVLFDLLKQHPDHPQAKQMLGQLQP